MVVINEYFVTELKVFFLGIVLTHLSLSICNKSSSFFLFKLGSEFMHLSSFMILKHFLIQSNLKTFFEILQDS